MIKLEESQLGRADIITHIANLSPAYVFDFESISHSVKTMITSGHRRIPVVYKNSKLAGILTYMDILDGLMRGLSRNTQISTFMTRDVIACSPTESIASVLQKMRISKRGGFPIIKDLQLIGIVSERDIIQTVSGKYFDIIVDDVMSHKPFFISSNSSIKNCMKAMVNTHYRRLPVVDNKEVVGIITGLDVLHFIDNNNYNSIRMEESASSIMSTPVRYVTKDSDISDAIKIMVEEKIGGLPVINEENNLKGIITERDIIELL